MLNHLVSSRPVGRQRREALVHEGNRPRNARAAALKVGELRLAAGHEGILQLGHGDVVAVGRTELQELVGKRAEAPNVRGRPVALLPHGLRRHPGWSLHWGLRPAGGLGGTEVAELHTEVQEGGCVRRRRILRSTCLCRHPRLLLQEHVRSLHVPVQDGPRMQISQGTGHRQKHMNELIRAKRSTLLAALLDKSVQREIAQFHT
mmetsp:Transcript_99153/g.289346  ORF Transcript_99153/g.289346 Transcript_99153/m.289346 type:complete len:204 (+) Transcript_99153:121-732(+)